MDIVNIESHAWEMMMARFSSLAERVEQLAKSRDDKRLKPWLDNHDACQILNISKRTLQSYRNSGKLGFTQIGYKIFYRPEDVEQLLRRMEQ